MRLKLIIMNIIYVIVSGVALLFLFTQAFFNINLGYTITRDSFKNVVGSGMESYVNEVIDEKGVNLKISIKVTSKMCFSTGLGGNSYANVKENILDQNIEDIAATVREPLSKLDKVATIKGVSISIKGSIYADIKDVDPTADPKTLTESAGITDEYIDSISEAFYNKIIEKNATYSGSMTLIYDAFDEMYKMLASKNALFLLKVVDINKRNDLDSSISTPLKLFGWMDDSNTLLTEDDSLCTLIGKIFGLGDVNTSHGDSEPLLLKSPESEEKDSSHFASLIKQLLYEKMDPVGDTIGLVFTIISYVYLFLVAAWILFALFCIIKSLFKNPGIFLGLFFGLNFFISIVIGILFVFVVPLLRNFVGIIPIIGQTIATFIKPFTIAISSGTTVAAFCLLGISLSMIIYGHWKKKRRDEI